MISATTVAVAHHRELSAIGFCMVTYAFAVLALGCSLPRETLKGDYLVLSSVSSAAAAAVAASCAFELPVHSSLLCIRASVCAHAKDPPQFDCGWKHQVTWAPVVVTIGIIASTTSSALASIQSASRVLQVTLTLARRVDRPLHC